MNALDATNDPDALSWVASANRDGCDFPIQNLPFGVFRRTGGNDGFRGGVAIGDEILDLRAAAEAGLWQGPAGVAAAHGAGATLNALMQLGAPYWTGLRRALFEALTQGSPLQAKVEALLVPQREAELGMPACIGDYTDFYSSIHHATAVGALFRPDNPLLPNYKWLPIAYHGRSSSIAVSGQSFHRPRGQRLSSGQADPVLGPSRRMDYELELGVFIGAGNAPGQALRIGEAESHVFGLCLLNDWSARDLQAWESQPLGPFLAKNFATTISPWIVTMQALAPFRVPFRRPAGDPAPLAYLTSSDNSDAGGIDIRLSAFLQTAAMRRRAEAPSRLSSSSYRHAYWTLAQLIAHHTVNGCNLKAGDLLGTGTQSGPSADEAGSLLELSRGGKHAIPVGSTERRTFLEDGDCVILSGHCEREGVRRIGFGEVRGCIEPPLDHPEAERDPRP